MSPQQSPSTDFERQLLVELRGVVADRAAAEEESRAAGAAAGTPPWRRGSRLALGGAVTLAAVAGALIVSAGGQGTSAAFAVEPTAYGGVSIQIHTLDDAGGLEQALDDAGIPSHVTYLATGMTCREPRFQAGAGTMPGGGSFRGFDAGNISGISVNGAGGGPSATHPGDRIVDRGTPGQGGEIDFDLSPDVFGPGQSLVLTAVAGPDGGTEGGSLQVRVAEGAVGPCEPVPA